MAVTTTWSVSDMQHNDSDGGVTIVYWSMVAQNDSGNESAQEGGKLRLTYDASSSDFIAYDSLTEADVLGWVYDDLREGEETATEAKTRVENERTAKVNAQITKNASTSNGVPWS
jgi:hypothetical protein